MQNKREFDGEIACFNDEDIEVMETFAKIIALTLKDSPLLGSKNDAPKVSEAGRIFGGYGATLGKKSNKDGDDDNFGSGSTGFGGGNRRSIEAGKAESGFGAIAEDDEDEDETDTFGDDGAQRSAQGGGDGTTLGDS